jgi:hypothetical protein
MEPQSLELIINAIAGPASGIIVALLCLSGFGFFMIKYLLPQQDRHIDKLLDDNKEQRKLFEKSINTVARRLDKVEDDVSDILSEVKVIKEKL